MDEAKILNKMLAILEVIAKERNLVAELHNIGRRDCQR